MYFTHDFRSDLDRIDWFGHPFALARFGDGEVNCIQEARYSPYGAGMGTETWTADGDMPLRDDLEASLRADDPGYCIGISPTCCQAKFLGKQFKYLRAPWHRITYATLFSYGNYNRFHERATEICLRKHGVLVAGKGGDIQVPFDAINRPGEEWLEPVLEELFAVRDKPILVAAGPAACVLVHQYWLRAPVPQIIVDVGSVFDEEIFGHGTRMHTVSEHDPRGMKVHMCEMHGKNLECHSECALLAKGRT